MVQLTGQSSSATTTTNTKRQIPLTSNNPLQQFVEQPRTHEIRVIKRFLKLPRLEQTRLRQRKQIHIQIIRFRKRRFRRADIPPNQRGGIRRQRNSLQYLARIVPIQPRIRKERNSPLPNPFLKKKPQYQKKTTLNTHRNVNPRIQMPIRVRQHTKLRRYTTHLAKLLLPPILMPL